MALIDDIRESRARIKDSSPKEKFDYYWYYYRFPVLITAILLFLIGGFIYSQLTRLDTVFNATLVNLSKIDTNDTSFYDNFATKINLNTEEEKIVLNDTLFIDVNTPNDEGSYYSLEKLSVLFSSYSTDFAIMTHDLFRPYAYGSMFCDLRDILSKEQLATYEPYFYYVDGADFKAISEASLKGLEYENGYKDPYKPELMTTPIPVGIKVTNATTLLKYYYVDPSSVIGIPSGPADIEFSTTFLDYIFEAQ